MVTQRTQEVLRAPNEGQTEACEESEQERAIDHMAREQ